MLRRPIALARLVVPALTFCAGHALVLAPAPAWAQAEGEATDGKAVLDAAAAAAKALQAVSYSIETRAVGGLLEGSNPPANATVRAVRAPGNQGVNGWLVHVSGTTEVKGESKPFAMAWKASSVEGLDADKKVLLERSGRSVIVPAASTANRARLSDVLTTKPYEQALRATRFDIEPSQTLDGQACDVIVAVNETSKTSVRFAIARSDKFPRKIEQIYDTSVVQGTVTTLITGVRIETDAANVTIIKPEDVKLALPEGFTEDRQGSAAAPRPGAAIPTPLSNLPNPNKPKESGEEQEQTPQPAQQPESRPSPGSAPQPKQPGGEVAAVMPETPSPGSDFALKDMNGSEVRLSDLRGSVVVIEFFGSWCLPCRAWHESLDEAITQARGNREVVTLALSAHERDSANAEAELASRDVRFRHLTNAASVASTWGVSAYPATFVIDASGAVVGSWQGPPQDTTMGQVQSTIATALNSGGVRG